MEANLKELLNFELDFFIFAFVIGIRESELEGEFRANIKAEGPPQMELTLSSCFPYCFLKDSVKGRRLQRPCACYRRNRLHKKHVAQSCHPIAAHECHPTVRQEFYYYFSFFNSWRILHLTGLIGIGGRDVRKKS